jgi:Mg/Co/Ni transporter MgtE
MNMICAAIADVLVPISMQKLNFDPALASPILVTTTTDTLGYFFTLVWRLYRFQICFSIFFNDTTA